MKVGDLVKIRYRMIEENGETAIIVERANMSILNPQFKVRVLRTGVGVIIRENNLEMINESR